MIHFHKQSIMPKTVLVIAAFCLLFVSCTETSEPEPYARAIDQTRFVIDTMRSAQDIPGLQLAVWHKGETVYSRGFGFSDLEKMVPVDPQTKMRIGSVSKTLTSVALGRLYEEEKLDLDAPVQQYVSYFPEKRYSITTRQVAGHIAGIRHYRGDEFLLARRFDSVRESLEIFADDTLLFKPGENYSYSSYGWNLISAVVEEAAGKPFLSYMNEEVFQPLGMEETVADYTDSLIYHRTSYYSSNDNGTVINAPYVDNSYKWAGGGYLGTAEDLIVFGEGLFWGDFLQSETLDMLLESQQLSSGEETNYGIGWRTGTDAEGRTYYGHSGGSVGGTTQFVVYPEQELILALIANMGGVSYRDVHLKIAGFFIEADGLNQ